jgi:hypothetical protein
MADANETVELQEAPEYEPPYVEDLERCEGASVTAAAIRV